MYMIPHRAGDADAPRRTFGLKPRGHVHRVAMQVCTVGNRVTDVNPEPKTDGPVRRLIAIMDVNLLLYLHSTTHRPIDAVEDDEQGVTAGLNDLPPCCSIVGSIRLRRRDRSLSRVPMSSKPMRRL